MVKAALLLIAVFTAGVLLIVGQSTTFDGRSDPCVEVPEACVGEPEP